MDMFNIDSTSVLTHFISKKSLMPVSELDSESVALIEMVG